MSDLPPYWRCKESRSKPGEFYYINVKTRVSTWIHPGEKKTSKDEPPAKDDGKKHKHKLETGKWTQAEHSEVKKKKNTEGDAKTPAESARLVLKPKRRSLPSPATCFNDNGEKRKSALKDTNTTDSGDEETPSKKIKTPAKNTDLPKTSCRETGEESASTKVFLPRPLEIDKSSPGSSKAKKRERRREKKWKKLLAEKKAEKEREAASETAKGAKNTEHHQEIPISTTMPVSLQPSTQNTKLVCAKASSDCPPPSGRKFLRAERTVPKTTSSVTDPANTVLTRPSPPPERQIIQAKRGEARTARSATNASSIKRTQRTPVSTPGQTPVASPVTTPLVSPVSTPVLTPGPSPVHFPVPSQVSTPISFTFKKHVVPDAKPTHSPIPNTVPFPVPTLLVGGAKPKLSPIPFTVSSMAPTGISKPVCFPTPLPSPLTLTTGIQSVIPSTSGTFALTTPPPHVAIMNEETAMDVDIDVLVFSDLMSVRQSSPLSQIQVPRARSTDISTPPPLRLVSSGNPSSSHSSPKLFIIVDTNVLMHDLKFIDDLKDRTFPGRGRPTLVIPWVVMQELDSLKDGKTGTAAALRTQLLARHPVNYLNQCLRSKHPRLICQTPTEDALADGVRVECNDDRVLTCCLQWTKKYPGAEVRLLTLDKNLRNKAMVSGIEADSILSLISWAEEGKCSSDEDDEGIGDESKMKTNSDASEKVLESLTDEILCELKTVLRESLSVVMETEMQAVYDNLWTNIIFRKPPWSLYDLLECFNKHWIAVFGDIIGRQKKHYLENLMSYFKPAATLTYHPQGLKELITGCGNFLQPLGRRSAYGGVLSIADQKLQVLYKVSRDVAAGTRQPAPLSELATHYGSHYTNKNDPSSSEDSNMTDNTTLSDIKRNQVQDTFQTAWENIIFCKDHLETHLFVSDPTKRAEYIAFFCRLVPVLMALNKAYAKMLEVPVAAGSNESEPFIQLSDALDLLAREAYIQPWTRLEPAVLQEFYSSPECRGVLENGYHQLQDMLQGLEHCWGRLTPEEQAQMPT